MQPLRQDGRAGLGEAVDHVVLREVGQEDSALEDLMNTQEEIAALKTATREAHEVIKDLRQAMKQAQRLIEDVSMEAEREVEELVNPVIEKTLAGYQATIVKATEEATDAVFNRFDTIFAQLMGEDRASRRRGQPSIPELVQKYLDEEDS